MNVEQNNAQHESGQVPIVQCYMQPFLFFNADCMDIMKQYPDKYFDLAIVDPPYGIKAGNVYSETSKVHGNSNAKRRAYKKIKWDDAIPNKSYFDELFRVSKNQIIWGGNYFTDMLPVSSGWVSWKKRDVKLDFNQLELAWTSNLKMSFIDVLWSGYWQPDMKNKQQRIHPTEKPTQLYDNLLYMYAKPEFKILDTHLGSGSIALAIDKANKLDNMNLEFVGVELDSEYYNAALNRFRLAHAQSCLSF